MPKLGRRMTGLHELLLRIVSTTTGAGARTRSPGARHSV
jgi:hypothetical protein